MKTGPVAPGTGRGFMPREIRMRFVSSMEIASAMVEESWVNWGAGGCNGLVEPGQLCRQALKSRLRSREMRQHAPNLNKLDRIEATAAVYFLAGSRFFFFSSFFPTTDLCPVFPSTPACRSVVRLKTAAARSYHGATLITGVNFRSTDLRVIGPYET